MLELPFSFWVVVNVFGGGGISKFHGTHINNTSLFYKGIIFLFSCFLAS